LSAPKAAPSVVGGAIRPGAGGSWLAAQGRLPLAFMMLGLVWFGVAAFTTASDADLLAVPHSAPAVVALAHIWVLGFFVTIAVGAIYQLAPVALSTTLWSERLGWWHLGLHGAAVPVMIYGFSHWQMALLGGAGAVLAAGVLLFAVNTTVTIFRSGKRDAVAWSLLLGASWLVVTVFAGLTLTANRLWNFWPTDPLLLLRAHAHLGLVGFFVTLVQGVTFRLIPMFTLAEVPDWRPVRVGLWLSQLGLLVLAPALAWHHAWTATIAGLAILLGLATSGWALRRTLATRKKRVLDLGVAAFVRGGATLVLAAGVALWLAAPSTSAGSMPGGLSANVYGVLLFLGGLLPVIAGMMNKIVPFLTWMRAYGPKVGRVPTPPATALSQPRLEQAAMLALALAVIPLLVGAWTLQTGWLRLGGIVLAAGAAAYLINMVLILKHLHWPVTLAVPARR
jgi:hypothetical protein